MYDQAYPVGFAIHNDIICDLFTSNTRECIDGGHPYLGTDVVVVILSSITLYNMM